MVVSASEELGCGCKSMVLNFDHLYRFPVSSAHLVSGSRGSSPRPFLESPVSVSKAFRVTDRTVLLASSTQGSISVLDLSMAPAEPLPVAGTIELQTK